MTVLAIMRLLVTHHHNMRTRRPAARHDPFEKSQCVLTVASAIPGAGVKSWPDIGHWSAIGSSVAFRGVYQYARRGIENR